MAGRVEDPAGRRRRHGRGPPTLAAAALLDTLARLPRRVGAEHCRARPRRRPGRRGPRRASSRRPAGLDRPRPARRRLRRAAGPMPTSTCRPAGPVVQIGMDTPQVTPPTCCAAPRPAGRPRRRARAGRGRRLVGARACATPTAAGAARGVPMSTPRHVRDTRRGAERARARRSPRPRTLRDVDTVADADRGRRAGTGSQFAARGPRGDGG